MTKLISSINIAIRTLNYLSFSKLLNFIRIIISYTLSRETLNFKAKIRPFFLSVEPADFCQLECPECPVGVSKRKQGTTLDIGLFNRIVDEQNTTLFHVQFYFQGEPLLHKKLPEMIAYAHKFKIFTSFSTNAQLLNSNTAKALVQSGLEKLVISLDGTTQEVYQKYRIGGKIQLVLNGINEINIWKKQLKSSTPFVEVQFVVFKTNEHQIAEMKELSKELNVDRLVFKSAQLYNYSQGNDLLTTVKKYARYNRLKNGEYQLKNKLHNRCFRLWSGAVVNSKGDLLPCCFDKDATHTFGNISETEFSSVYLSSKANGFRAAILQNRKQFEMCRNCTSN